MKVIITENYAQMSEKAAEIIIDIVKNNPKAVLGLATGSSPIGTYQLIAKDHRENGTSYSQVSTVNLDEYVGLTADHNQSYAYFMRDNLFNHIDIDLANTNLPSGVAKDLSSECDRYNALLENYKQDVQVLGLGSNGHIGFNEPNDMFVKGTNCVNLAQSTIDANARFFEKKEDVPTQAYTMGIQTIMNAKKILVVVNGEGKADIVEKAFFGDITPQVPASILQLHPDVIVVGDAAAFSKIKNLI